MAKTLHYILASPPDRERVVVEIWFGDSMFAEVNYEGAEMTIQVYPSESNKPWEFSLCDLLKILEKSKAELSKYDLT